MSILSSSLPVLGESGVSLEAFDRSGEVSRRIDGRQLIGAIRAHRAKIAAWSPERRLLGLLFRSEEAIEFLVAALAAMAEGYTVVPLYPNWNAETQALYLSRYGIRSLALSSGFAARAREWRDRLDNVLEVDLDAVSEEAVDGAVFPDDLSPEHPCAWIFTSGTSGELAKCTEITLGNLESAIENIRRLEFVREGMVVHSPLSMSHIFAFVVAMAFLSLRPRRMLFSDVQYLSRLPQERTGKVDALILVPIVLQRLRAAFYEKLLRSGNGAAGSRNATHLDRLPVALRRAIKRTARLAEESIIDLEQGRFRGRRGMPAITLVRALFGKRVRRFLGSPEFIVVGGAKPSLEAMALLEVMGIRCLQGWGMTETTGPLCVCDLRDRFRGAFGTCGELFPGTGASLIDGELVVEGPQIARGYVEPDGTLVPFGGAKRTGDRAAFDARGRLKILGKISDRITTANGLNYQPAPMEESIRALDLERENVLDDAVVVGDGKPRLGCVFFLREGYEDGPRTRAYLERLLRKHNLARPIDEKIGPWTVSDRSLKEAEVLGPSGKLVRRRVEEAFSSIYEEVFV